MNLTKNKKSRKEKKQAKLKQLEKDLVNNGYEYRMNFINGYYTLFKICFFSVITNIITIILLIVLFGVGVSAV